MTLINVAHPLQLLHHLIAAGSLPAQYLYLFYSFDHKYDLKYSVSQKIELKKIRKEKEKGTQGTPQHSILFFMGKN